MRLYFKLNSSLDDFCKKHNQNQTRAIYISLGRTILKEMVASGDTRRAPSGFARDVWDVFPSHIDLVWNMKNIFPSLKEFVVGTLQSEDIAYQEIAEDAFFCAKDILEKGKWTVFYPDIEYCGYDNSVDFFPYFPQEKVEHEHFNS